MSADFPERDWKAFRQLRELALQRFSQNVLSQVAQISCSGESAHQRYLRVFEIIHEQNRDMAHMFDNPRRSRAWEQLCMIKAAGLLTDEEMLRFSVDTQDSVRQFVAHLTNR